MHVNRWKQYDIGPSGVSGSEPTDQWGIGPENEGLEMWAAMLLYWGSPRARPWWRHQMEAFSALLALCEGNPSHKGQWRGILMFSLICAWTNCWANNRCAGDLRRHRSHYDVTTCMKLFDIKTMLAWRHWTSNFAIVQKAARNLHFWSWAVLYVLCFVYHRHKIPISERVIAAHHGSLSWSGL